MNIYYVTINSKLSSSLVGAALFKLMFIFVVNMNFMKKISCESDVKEKLNADTGTIDMWRHLPG